MAKPTRTPGDPSTHETAPALDIEVSTESGRATRFRLASPKSRSLKENGFSLSRGAGEPIPVKITPPDPTDRIVKISYILTLPLRNFHSVIIPDTGRNYAKSTQLVQLWGLRLESQVGFIRMPLYILLGHDQCTSLAFGIIGENCETSFITAEPHSTPALSAYNQLLVLEIRRGGEWGIPAEISRRGKDGAITEYVYCRNSLEPSGEPWVATLRDFAAHQQRLLRLAAAPSPTSALEPLWCSWVDWRSDEVDQTLILDQVKAGRELGVTNYIIDDGWFGPGLDTSHIADLRFGDWQPDPRKYEDMAALVKDIHREGCRALIWCAPHLITRNATCYERHSRLLMCDDRGEIIANPHGRNTLSMFCLRNAEARRVMAQICENLLRKYDFDGAKYDLFNQIPDIQCHSTNHTHDCDSQIVGLERLLRAIHERCRAVKQDYLVELKQNYGTPFLARYGAMMRAGDTPYDSTANFMKTAYIQAYSPCALNDYQTINSNDPPESAALIIIRMLAVGIPACSIDFLKLSDANKGVLRHYHRWYRKRLQYFTQFRTPLDGALTTWKLEAADEDLYFLLHAAPALALRERKNCTILNATGRPEVYLDADEQLDIEVATYDCQGRRATAQRTVAPGPVRIPVGGMAECRLRPARLRSGTLSQLEPKQ